MMELQTYNDSERQISLQSLSAFDSSIPGPFDFCAQPRLVCAEQLDRLGRYEMAKHCSRVLLRWSSELLLALLLMGGLGRVLWVKTHLLMNETFFSFGSVKVLLAITLVLVGASLGTLFWIYSRFSSEFCTSEFYPMVSKFLDEDLSSLAARIARLHERRMMAVFLKGLRAIEIYHPQSYLAALIRTIPQRASADDVMVLCKEGARLAREADQSVAEKYLIAGLEAINGWHQPMD